MNNSIVCFPLFFIRSIVGDWVMKACKSIQIVTQTYTHTHTQHLDQRQNIEMTDPQLRKRERKEKQSEMSGRHGQFI